MFELEDRIAIAFNGSYNLQHYIVDIDIALASLEGAIPTAADEYVHEGFLLAFLSMRKAIEFWLQAEPERLSKPLLIAGHSMGAALATICARFCSELPAYKNRPNQLCIVTFGSPCVGNTAFADSVRSAATEIWRVVNEADPVPAFLESSKKSSVALLCCCGCCMLCCCKRVLPRVMHGLLAQDQKYQHVGTEILMNRDGMMMVEPAFYEARYFGISKYPGMLGIRRMVRNHNNEIYEDCLRMWIHQVHKGIEEELLSKIAFQEYRESLGVSSN